MSRLAANQSGVLCFALLAIAPIRACAETVALPTFDVIATTPLGGGEIDATKVPGSVWQTGAADIEIYKDSTVTETLARQAPGVTVGNVSGNDFQPDISYRGFDATPVSGTAQGLAVYQNGVRINEAFGDTVNWDLIPANAIDKMTILAGNPIFGLNALGGALSVTMKNGFTWQGFEADLRGGSFGRAQTALQFGKQVGDYSVFLAAEEIADGGWRVDGSSQVSRFYGDVGYKANGGEIHLNMTAANNMFGVAASTPIQLLQNYWGSVYTVPQTTANQLATIGLTGSYAQSSSLSFQGGLYFRSFNQAHVDGNSTNVTPCPPESCLNGNPVHDTLGQIVPDISQNGAVDLGEIDRSWTQSRSVGGNAQAVDADTIYGHDNTLTIGASLDYGWTNFNGNSQLGVIGYANNSFPVIGSPYFLDEPGSYLAPVNVNATNLYMGLYALDTFSMTPALSLTGGARLNYAAIDLQDQNGGLVNGYSTYAHVNPVVGLTYDISHNIVFYAGYAMSNRAPTPLELGCADPVHPCIIDNFLLSDPHLQQVVGNTFQAGFRGQQALGENGNLQWSAGLFRTTLTNDIVPLQSPENGFGYYANVGTTLRQGAELSVQWRNDRWSVYANYTCIDAVYLTTFMEPSPFNPSANAAGLVPIMSGTPIAGIPRSTVKVGFDFNVTDNWKIGADMVAASGQTIFGNENGAVPQVPGYAVLGAHTSYQVSKQLQVYGLVQNIFNQHYYTYGGLYDTGALPNAAPYLTDPRSLGPAAPFAIYAGLKYTI
jgi:iron complex outermembrane receptor protein